MFSECFYKSACYQKLEFIYSLLFIFLVIITLGQSSTFAITKQDGLLYDNGLLIIPEPKLTDFTGEKTHIGNSIKINTSYEMDPFIKNFLEMEIILSDKKGGIKECTLELVSEEKFEGVENNNGQAYKLVLEEKKAFIKSISSEGLFNGVQTFLQLVQKNKFIPIGEITDWPDLEWRAVHFDTKHHQDRFEHYREMVPKLAQYKINAIVFEIEDKLAYVKHPHIGAQGAFTKQKMRELADLARKHYIDFIPLVQGLGHVRYIVKHPEYAHLRELPESTWQVCPLKDESFKLLYDLYDEAIEATGTAKYFHIGGDESYDLALCPDCKKSAEKIGKGGVYLIWLNKVAKYLEKKGLSVIIWDDMALKFDKKNLNKLPKNVIYMRWGYHTNQVEKTALFEKGYKCMIAPATQCTTPMFPDYENRLQNIAYYTSSGRDKGALGSLCTAWDDSGLNMELFWLGFVASAEYSWSGDKPGLDEYRNKFVRNFYGPNAEDLLTVYNILSQSGDFWNNSRGKNFWRRSETNRPIQFPPLPNQQLYNNGEWNEYTSNQNFALNVSSEASRLKRLYVTAEKILLSNLSKSVDNKLNLEIMLSITRMMKLNVNLLITRYELAKDFSLASQFADAGKLELASGKLNDATNRMESLISEKQNAKNYLQQTWQKNQYPRDRSDLGKPMPYYVDRFRLHLAELSANYDYMFWIEKTINLEKYYADLKKIKTQYDENMKKSDTKLWRK
jgi:hexosaminidase